MKDLQTVLDALDNGLPEARNEAIAIVKQMMQAEPVAWIVEFENGEQELHFNDTKESLGESQTTLYAAPQAVPVQAEPVGYVLAWNDMDYVGCVISGTRHKDYVPVFAAPQVLPVGFVLVPVEPTPEMISAGRTTPMPSDSEFDEDGDYRAVYKAMLEAAPKGAV